MNTLVKGDYEFLYWDKSIQFKKPNEYSTDVIFLKTKITDELANVLFNTLINVYQGGYSVGQKDFKKSIKELIT